MIIEKEVNGKVYGFCFNFYAFGIAEEVLNLPIDDILKSLSPDGNKVKKPIVKTICALFYAGARNYCEMKDKAIDFKINDVGGWITEIGFAEALKMLTDAVTISTPKNIDPPQTEGEKAKVGELLNT